MIQNTSRPLACRFVTARAGRPRQFDVETTLDAAVDLFWRRGAGVTTRDLESELGLSQSSIYNAFGSKRALHHAALARYEEMIEERLLSPLEHPEADRRRLDAFFDALGEWIGDRRGCMLTNLFCEAGGDRDDVRDRAEAYRLRLRTAFRAVLERSGAPMPDDRSELLVLAVLGLNLAARCGADADEIARLRDATTSQIDAWCPGADGPAHER